MKKSKNVCVAVVSLCLFGTQLFSQEKAQEKKMEQLEEIVISATKFELKKENTGKVIYKISQKDIQRNAGKSVIELLNNVLGIEIRGVNSNPGEPRSTYIRGGRSRQALVLIDGIPLSDPTGIEQSYDLRLISLNQIESIEILKGASSTLYGSGAGTGVINIILKKASENNVSGVYEVSLGTNATSKNSTSSLNDKNQNISINGTLDKLKYNAFFNITGNSGFSSAKSTLTIPFEEDTYSSNNGFLKLGYEFNTQLRMDAFLNYDEFDYTFDAGAFNDSDVNLGNQEQFRIGIRPRLKYKKGEVFLNASINSLDRSFESFNSFSGGTNVFIYKGTSVNLDFVNKYEFTKNFQLITGINYQKHENESISDFGNIDPDLANFNVVDPYVSAVYITDFGLSINAGSRLNIHSNYGNNFVYDTNLAFGIVKNETINLKLISSYSTAFIAPSLYQLYSDYGATNLAPETNRTFEFGFDSKLGKQWALSAVYYNRLEENKVIFLNLPTPPYGMYSNALETIDVSGIEADVTFTISEELITTVGYAFVDKTSDIDYIPKNKLTASFVVNPIKNLAISTMFKNVGKRSLFDAFGSFGEAGKDVILPSYSLLDMNVNYKVLEGKVLFFGSITNLLNEEYEETIGFNTRGRNFKMGIRIQF